eukprot:2676958-Pleurochrysis_carterae.AAC.1
MQFSAETHAPRHEGDAMSVPTLRPRRRLSGRICTLREMTMRVVAQIRHPSRDDDARGCAKSAPFAMMMR